MHWYTVSAVGLAMFSVALVAQTPAVTGDHSSPLRPARGGQRGNQQCGPS